MADEGFSIGYNAWAGIALQPSDTYIVTNIPQYIGGTIVQVTSASVSRTASIPTVTPYYAPYEASTDASNSFSESESLPDNELSARGEKRTGYGTFTFTGEITFEMTRSAVQFVLNEQMFRRASLFSLQFYDGKQVCTIYNCAWSSITLTGSPNSMVTASISFASNNALNEHLMISNEDFRTGQFYEDTDFFVPYWMTGAPGIEDFTLSFSRNAQPVFLNNDYLTPTYIRTGVTQVSVQATMAEYIGDNNGIVVVNGVPRLAPINLSEGQLSIQIGEKTVKLNNRILSSATYNMSSMNDIGKKNYSWNSIMDSPAQKVFTICDTANYLSNE